MKKKKTNLIAFGILLIAIAGCGVYSNISSDYDRSADFTQYKSFAWIPDKDSASGQYDNQIMRNNIRNYFSHCMGDRGYVGNTSEPDLLMELVVTNSKKEKTYTFPTYNSSPWYYSNPYYYPYPNAYYYRSYNYNNHYSYYQGYSSQSYTTEKVDYVDGAITLNFIDRKQNKLVWSGTAQGDIYDASAIADNLHPAIHNILKDYPVKPIESKKEINGINN